MNSLLKDKVIYISKSESDTGKAFDVLSDSGARLICEPSIDTVPVEVGPQLSELFKSQSSFDFLVFTSANSVRFFAALIAGGKRDFSKTKIAAIGGKTSAVCEKLGYKVDLVPAEFSASGLIGMFADINIKGKKFLIPCSDIARDELEEGLLNLGAIVFRIPVYKTVCASDAVRFRRIVTPGGILPDIYVFTSPSSFHCFCELMAIHTPGEYFLNRHVAAIGNTTADAIRNSGVEDVAVPDDFTLEAVAKLIVNEFAGTTENF